MNNKIVGNIFCVLSAYSILNYYFTCTDSILGISVRINQLLITPEKKSQKQSQDNQNI